MRLLVYKFLKTYWEPKAYKNKFFFLPWIYIFYTNYNWFIVVSNEFLEESLYDFFTI